MALILLLATTIFLAPAFARPEDSFNLDGYKFSYTTLDGSSRYESGSLRNRGSEDEELVVQGQFSWVDPAGGLHRFRYIADKSGYHATEVSGDRSRPSPVTSNAEIQVTPFSGPGLSIRGALAG
ncbi:endocuticle structural glycoprotein ABD-5-like isoform X2 [Bacillus rossius redtenbacheri]|uniref:endocuticle structural glycoprotein ABD-5-like isoform X2 n=1 Tax=Bacillus rossius redtenbacheri TaxID=93214 RepID=UPI002FDCC76E